MPELPETRESLLIRLADSADAAAWDEFVAIYRPLIVRIALSRGLQASDADDLAQQVLVSVSRAIGDWKKEPARGSFRQWLRTVARNAIINRFQRAPREVAVGGSKFLSACQEIAAPTTEIVQWIDAEHERSVLRLAATRIERVVAKTTWQAFWRTAMNGESVQDVAKALGISVGKVYGAKGRVMKMLTSEVAKIQDGEL